MRAQHVINTNGHEVNVRTNIWIGDPAMSPMLGLGLQHRLIVSTHLDRLLADLLHDLAARDAGAGQAIAATRRRLRRGLPSPQACRRRPHEHRFIVKLCLEERAQLISKPLAVDDIAHGHANERVPYHLNVTGLSLQLPHLPGRNGSVAAVLSLRQARQDVEAGLQSRWPPFSCSETASQAVVVVRQRTPNSIVNSSSALRTGPSRRACSKFCPVLDLRTAWQPPAKPRPEGHGPSRRQAPPSDCFCLQIRYGLRQTVCRDSFERFVRQQRVEGIMP